MITVYLVHEFKEVFRIRLGSGPPADVAPMTVKIKPGARPFRAKARRYKAEQRKFMNKYLKELVEMGFMRPNPNAEWASPPLIVPKPGSTAKYRFTIDLRGVNSATVPITWPMPHIESELMDFQGSTCFAVIDFVSGYWQLLLDEDA